MKGKLEIGRGGVVGSWGHGARCGQAGFNSSGIVSTDTNGGSLTNFTSSSSSSSNTPAGTWNIRMDGLTDAFANNKIQDVIMVISYDVDTPQWI